MKKAFIILFFIVAISAKANAQLVIKINNITSIQGDIHIGIYDEPELFLSLTEQYIFKLIKVESEMMVLTLDSIPKGYYAISIMHDLNSNGKMDNNFFGIPKEPYGFSQNIKPLFRAPQFEDSQFYFDGEFFEVEINLLD